MIYLYIYIASVFIAQVLSAINNHDANARTTIAATYLWPIILIIILIVAIGWDFDVQASKYKFRFRRRSDSILPGFAIAIFNIEFQFWKRAK